ncbi:hypothetical protein GCM10023206_03610 [Acinetobacter puyangensis]|uniref:Uncharacterized protein n=1 Tax=Acinetobacter puyangensis TaxID=1096779 RepID=A0A240E6A0_9GAMM|nr:hypothetical protein [Acinetobacter puyangensis]SNX44288.1 hypothetical protein SAMN05421731_10322 [Acinetobacter puyangensis]
MQHQTLGTEAIRAFFTLQCCWLNNEEIYLEQGCLHCGSAATYLIYYTNRHIQDLMLDFIGRYNCHHPTRFDLRDLEDFEQNYVQFLERLELEINHYARKHHADQRTITFEQIDSIFENQYSMVC